MREHMKLAFAVVVASATLLVGAGRAQSTGDFELVSTIAFSSTRNNPTCNPFLAGEIFLMSPNGSHVQQLTNNDNCTHADAFAALAPDGKKTVFDSNRLTASSGTLNLLDLFLMDSDGSALTLLTRGSSATWSPDSKYVAFQASASYYASGGSVTGTPIGTGLAGTPMSDSNIFVVNVDDRLSGVATPTNITNSPDTIDSGADWSPLLPDGTTKIAFTRHSANYPFCPELCNYPDTEIYVINADGTGLTRLTHNDYEEAAPAWSPDGSHIAYMCRIGPLNSQGFARFQICVMDAGGDESGTISPRRLTFESVPDVKPSWSPDGKTIVFHREAPFPTQLWIVNADTTCNDAGVCTCESPYANGSCEMQLTHTVGFNVYPHWGYRRVHVAE